MQLIGQAFKEHVLLNVAHQFQLHSEGIIKLQNLMSLLMENNWEPIIGLEVHVQLNTNSKLFSGAPNKFGGAANSQASLIDLGYPGTLPVVNEEAIEMALKLGIALDGDIPSKPFLHEKTIFIPIYLKVIRSVNSMNQSFLAAF